MLRHSIELLLKGLIIREEKKNRRVAASKIKINGRPLNNTHLQQRLNGCDYDSDTMLITNDSWIIEGVKLCYERFGVPVCKIDPMGKTAYENTSEGLAQLDRTIAKNHIGEIINLSQFLNCLFWDRLMSGEPFDSLMPMYYEICKLAVLSGMEIDKAKRMYDVNADKVLRLLEKPRIEFKKKNGGKLPNFFYFMVGQESNVSPDNQAAMNTPMSYLYDAVENLDRKQRENVTAVSKAKCLEKLEKLKD